MGELAMVMDMNRQSTKLLKKIRDKLADHEAQIHYLSSEVQSKSEQLTESDEKLKEMECLMDEMKAKNKNQKIQIKERDRTIVTLTYKLTLHKSSTVASQPTNGSKKSTKPEMDKKLEEKIKELDLLIKQKDEDNDHLQRKFDQGKVKIEELRSRLESRNQKIRELEHFEGQYIAASQLLSNRDAEDAQQVNQIHNKLSEETKRLNRLLIRKNGDTAKRDLKDRLSSGQLADDKTAKFLTKQIEDIWALDKKNMLVAPDDSLSENAQYKSIENLYLELTEILTQTRAAQIIDYNELETRLRALVAMAEDVVEKNVSSNVNLSNWVELFKAMNEHLAKGKERWTEFLERGPDDENQSVCGGSSNPSRFLASMSGNPIVRDFSFPNKKRRVLTQMF